MSWNFMVSHRRQKLSPDRGAKSTPPSLVKGAGRRRALPVMIFVAAMLIGIGMGAGAAYRSDMGTVAEATAFWSQNMASAERFKPKVDIADLPDRFTATIKPRSSEPIPVLRKPRLVIIIDDLGWNAAPVKTLVEMEAPLTLAFLPYAIQSQNLADLAIENGHEVMLHLPMQAGGRRSVSDGNGPGPDALTIEMSEQEILASLAKNLAKFKGYRGVNNHMGSLFTRDPKRMEIVLRALKDKGYFFLDSRTSGKSKVAQAAMAADVDILTRNIFLDADFGAGGVEAVNRQLDLVERIAIAQGQAIAIGHPYKTTVEALEKWLPTAQARGFEIVPASALLPVQPPVRNPQAMR